MTPLLDGDPLGLLFDPLGFLVFISLIYQQLTEKKNLD